MDAIKSYLDWKQTNEGLFGIGKSKEVMFDASGKKHKVVVNFKDTNTFKVRIVNDTDILDPQSKLTDAGFSILFNYLNSENSFVNVYGKLDDAFYASKFLVYSVNRDNERKQVITFNIAQRASAPQLPKEQKYISSSDLTANNYSTILQKEIQKDATVPMDQPKVEEKPTSDKITISEDKLPIERAKVQNLVDENVKNVQAAIISKFEKKLANVPLFIKFKGYTADGKYGPTTAKMIHSIKSAFTDPKMSETSGDLITKEFVDRLNSEVITESYLSPITYRLIEGFDMDAFNKAASTPTPGTTKKEDTVKKEEPTTDGAVKLTDDQWKEVKVNIAKVGGVGVGTTDSGDPYYTLHPTGKSGIYINFHINSRIYVYDKVNKIAKRGTYKDNGNTFIMDNESTQITLAALAKNPTRLNSKTLITQITNLIKGAHKKIEWIYDYDNNSDFFQEWKGNINDDEDSAVEFIFGSNSSDSSSYWYKNIYKKYLSSAKNKVSLLLTIKPDSEEASHLSGEIDKFNGLYKTLKEKTYGSTMSDSHSWSFTDTEGNKTNYSVDTDF